MLTDDSLIVGSEREESDDVNVPFVAPCQANTIKRSLVRFGISYQELAERPDYWSFEKKMAEFKSKFDTLKAEHEKLTDQHAELLD